MENVLNTTNLTKIYGKKTVVDKVSMNIRKGQIYGLIGKNGAGKTTIMRMIAGLAFVNDGEIRLFDSNDLDFQRRRIGYIIESPALYPRMTAVQNLEIYRRLNGVPDKDCIPRLLEMVDLSDTAKKKVKHFSLGMKQRLGIAISLMGNPDFLILDEPINGLDPKGIKDMRELLLRLNRENEITILMSSHILGEMSKIATCYGILKKGELVTEITSEQLAVKCKRCLKIRVDDVKKATAVLENIIGTTNYDVLPENNIRLFDCIDRPAQVNMELSKNGVMVETISEVGQDLEEFFMEQMGGILNE